MKQICLGVSLPYMETCVKLGRNLSMTSSCLVPAAGRVFHAKVHVNVPTDRTAPRPKHTVFLCCVSLLRNLMPVTVTINLHQDA